MTLMDGDDARWAAVVARDPSARFFYSVATTGVVCKPSCAARRPRRENVRFHRSVAAAVAEGFRACKRCRPDREGDRDAELVASLCRVIDAADAPVPLAALARHAKLSPFHVHRLFKRVTGLTPRAWAAATRAERVRGRLAAGAPVTTAIYDAGYGSSSRFYERATRTLGMTPTQYRRGGARLVVRWASSPCSLGVVLVATTERGVCAIFLGDAVEALVRDLGRQFAAAEVTGPDRALARTVRAVVRKVEDPAASLELPLDVRGTAFQRRVWRALGAIAPGKRATYAQIAAKLGVPRGARAVAAACAANVLALAIPCHRVVRGDGELAGYRWGVQRKEALLAREQRSR
jgi:AraC family transcriptional regulator of adaptative response/methylated-DNA-[protein]-cysteine methyltransferase